MIIYLFSLLFYIGHVTIHANTQINIEDKTNFEFKDPSLFALYNHSNNAEGKNATVSLHFLETTQLSLSIQYEPYTFLTDKGLLGLFPFDNGILLNVANYLNDYSDIDCDELL